MILSGLRQNRRKAVGHKILELVDDDADFSVVLFRPKFMLVSEGCPMKTHKNQWLLTLLSLPDIPCGAPNQGTYPDTSGADAFAVT